MNETPSHKPRMPHLPAARVRPAAPRRAKLFGGWLPLLAFYDPPCHRDGSPWDGHEDPGFRITTLVLGWFGYAVSVTLGTARPAKPLAAISALDERIRTARSRDE